MKKTIALAALALAFCSAYAGEAASRMSTTLTANPVAQSSAQAAGGAIEGNAIGNIQYSPTSTNYGSKIPVASAAAPIITTSNDTCMGSSSGGAQGAAIGVSFGTTWTDANCVLLKNARELWNMGLRNAAVARMCMDPKNKEALEVAGTPCPDFDEYRRDPAAYNRKVAAKPQGE